MTAAVFGLLGVVVGAVINGALSMIAQRRTERADLRSAARLVRTELVGFRALALEGTRRTADELPQLRGATPVLWHSNRALLSRGLVVKDWEAVALAYAHVDALLSVLVFEADGVLLDWRQREAWRLLAALVDPAEHAARALRVAAGVEPGNKGDEGSEFPEQGPVAA
jgi:hypothetical protein